MSETKELVYRDFDIRFICNPITGRLNIKKNSDSIKQALKNLILTDTRERRYNPNFGASIYSMLFENYDPITISNIRHQIKTSIENFEPRVELLDIKVTGEADRNELYVTIMFRPINSVETVTMTVQLQRTR